MSDSITLAKLAEEFINPTPPAKRNGRHDAEIRVLRLCRRLEIDLLISAEDAERIRAGEVKPGPKPWSNSPEAKAQRKHRAKVKKEKGTKTIPRDWIAEDRLPGDLSNDDYDDWFARSKIVDGIRIGPRFPLPPIETILTVCRFCDKPTYAQEDNPEPVCNECEELETESLTHSLAAEESLEPITEWAIDFSQEEI